jgi:hypothetical protein
MFNRPAVQDALKQFASGSLSVLDIPNPVWYPGNEDLLNFAVRPNFQLREFAVSVLRRVNSRQANQKNAPNILIDRRLASAVQSLRNRVSSAYPTARMRFESGYRPPAIDRMVGGSGRGLHTMGRAGDFEFLNVDPKLSPEATRRGIAYEAYRQKDYPILGIELILGTNVHFDVGRITPWYAMQAISHGRYVYPLISPLKELAPYCLPKFK